MEREIPGAGTALASRTAGRRGGPADLLFAALLVVHLVPIWAFRYLPTQDGPSHLYNAWVLRAYARPDAGVLRAYYAVNPRPEPTWILQLALAGGIAIAGPLVAEKLLVSGFVLFLPLAARRAARWIGGDPLLAGFLALPLVYTYTLHMGFYTFSYSIPLFLLSLAWFVRHERELSLGPAAVLGGLLFLLFCAHLVSFVAALLALAVLTVTGAAADVAGRGRSAGSSRPAREIGLRIAWTVFACIPAAAFFVVWRRWHPGVPIRLGSGWDARVLFRGPEELVSFQDAEKWAFRAELVLLLLLAGGLAIRKLRTRAWERKDALLLSVPLFWAVSGALPASVAVDQLVRPRLALVTFAALALGAASSPPVRRAPAMAVGAAVAACLLLLHVSRYSVLNDYLREYVSGEAALEPRTTLLPLDLKGSDDRSLGRDVSSPVEPFLHAADYMAMDRGLVDLSNYEARMSWFPLRFRTRFDPVLRIGQADAITLWKLGAPEASPDEERDRRLARVAREYGLVFRSRPRGLLEIYRRRPGS